MGCGFSTTQTLVEPHGVGRDAAVKDQARKDAVSLKKAGSYTKNQVVPEDGAEKPAFLGLRPASSASSSASAAAAGLSGDFAADLALLCSQKVAGAGLARLAEQLHTVMKLSLSGYLRSATSPSCAGALAKCVSNATACCNAVLQPVLAHINRLLSSKEASSSLSDEPTSWDKMEFADLLGLLETSCNAVYDLGVMEVGRPAALLMDIVFRLHQHCEGNKIPLAAGAIRVAAVSELMSMMSIIFFRTVALETQDSALAKLEDYQQLRDQLGWSSEHIATTSDPQTAAMLYYLQQVAVAGEKRAGLVVRRTAAFWDGLAFAKQLGLVPAPAGVACYKIFPSFIDQYTQANSRKPAVEAGEGHGPRKEFFVLAGQDMVGQGQPKRTSGAGSEAPDSGAASAGPSPSAQHPPLWTFNRTAGTYWYNTQLARSAELVTAYTFAGWLMGQAVNNRAPLGLPLPPVLFQSLLQGDLFHPGLSDLQDFDPDAAASVRKVAALPPADLRAMLELEGLHTDWSAEQYMGHAARAVLVDGVRWQAEAVAAGMFTALDARCLRLWSLDAQALSALVFGPRPGGGAADDNIDVRGLFRVTLDEELSGNSAVLVELLWEVLAKWPSPRRLRFVEFVTGTARLPLPGSELLKIQAPFVAMGAEEHTTTMGMLPQAHTCDNLLELPNYYESLLFTKGIKGGPSAVARGSAALSAAQLQDVREEVRRILDDRLLMAVMNFEGYGLDERARGRSDGGDERSRNASPATTQRASLEGPLGPPSPLNATTLSMLNSSHYGSQVMDLLSTRASGNFAAQVAAAGLDAAGAARHSNPASPLLRRSGATSQHLTDDAKRVSASNVKVSHNGGGGGGLTGHLPPMFPPPAAPENAAAVQAALLAKLDASFSAQMYKGPIHSSPYRQHLAPAAPGGGSSAATSDVFASGYNAVAAGGGGHDDDAATAKGRGGAAGALGEARMAAGAAGGVLAKRKGTARNIHRQPPRSAAPAPAPAATGPPSLADTDAATCGGGPPSLSALPLVPPRGGAGTTMDSASTHRQRHSSSSFQLDPHEPELQGHSALVLIPEEHRLPSPAAAPQTVHQHHQHQRLPPLAGAAAASPPSGGGAAGARRPATHERPVQLRLG